MSIHEGVPTEVQHRQNLARLANHLDTTPSMFDMGSYEMCALAQGRHVVDRKPFEGHFDYARRAFGIDYVTNVQAYCWLFGGWTCDRYSAKGAAARIRYYLKHGTPESYSSTLYRDDVGKIRPEYEEATA